MDKSQENFLKELLSEFKIEASEHYETLVNGLIKMESSTDDTEQAATIELIFREVHSLKGASRAVNLLDIEKLCMSLENIFNSLKKKQSTLSPQMFESFHKAADLLNLLLIDVNENKTNAGKYNLGQIVRNLDFVHQNSLITKDNESQKQQISVSQKSVEETIIENEVLQAEEVIEKEETIRQSPAENQTVRISTQKLSDLLQQSEELISIKSTFEFYTKELQNIQYQFAQRYHKSGDKNQTPENGDWALFVSNYLASEKNFQKKHEDELYRLGKDMEQFQRVTNRMIDELLHDVKTTLLFPFSSMLGIFPKIVRDLSKEYSKEIDLDITGDTIEIDRRILEEIKDPLIHLIRNCIDHGIETTAERLAKKKSKRGKIEIKIIQNIDRKIEIHITDNGAGIDKNRIINAAKKIGIIKEEDAEKLTDKEIYSLIFSSGISTSPFITDISGRGLGMAIVAEKVTKLGGTIDLETTQGAGTHFTISLPQTLSTFRGVLIKSSEQFFVLPSSVVERAIRIETSEIKSVESRKTILHKNETLALVALSDILKITKLNKKKSDEDHLHILILNTSQRKIALVVDEILGEQEGIVKDLGMQLQHVKNMAGTTILGNGKIVPILHPSELMDSSTQAIISTDFSNENKNAADESIQKSILVAEDSITIRTLLRNFIESAGFAVKTAVDGQEAFNFLQNESFDLIVSDIEMPRMNGFELTAKIRENKKYVDLPIILVTALETIDDKQRGMQAGANAYIVKSSFEKSNLIDTIQRLL
ncbi:MAG: response regulator [Bacteroidales bacterium]|nr:response regulator [Bacteroidales bacterium]